MNQDKSHIEHLLIKGTANIGRRWMLGSTIFVFLVFVLSGCNIAKQLEKEEILYDKVTIKIDSENKVEHKDGLKDELYALSRPKPNKRFLNVMRPRLWFYYWGDEDKKGLKRWMSKRSEEPVLLDTFFVENNCLQMETFLFDKGYYEASCDYETDIDRAGKEAAVTYVIDLKSQTVIDTVIFQESGQAQIDSLIRADLNEGNGLIKQGTAFDVSEMKQERKRIKGLLRENGYFDFGSSSKDVAFQIDSSSTAANEVDFYLNINQYLDSLDHEQYFINDIYVDVSHNVDVAVKDTQFVDGMYIVGNDKQVKPELLTRRIVLSKGQVYALSKHRTSFDNLQGLGIYRFVTLHFEPTKDNQGRSALNVFIRLTPSKKMKYSAELETSNRYKKTVLTEGLGVAGSILFQNKNTFKGAERFSIDIQGGAYFNATGDSITTSILNTLNLSGETSLLIPKMITPFPLGWLGQDRKERILGSNIQTRIAASYNFFRLISLYSVNSFDTSFGYVWQPNARNRFLLTPVSISYSTVFATTPEFDDEIKENIRLQKAFDDQLIISGLYSWLTTNELSGVRRNFYKFRGDLELAGNTLALIENIFNADFSNGFGIDYSQFVRLQADYRYYVPSGKATFVSRLFAGIGIPYGKTDLNVLPYVRQFFTGGSTGLRAFPLRGVGPGTWAPLDTNVVNTNFERTGDIKIEANLEYRFPIYKWFKGALFVDAGNVWTINDTSKVGSEFSSNFLGQLGLGGGFGMRLDFTYFILRVDLATPFYIPTEYPSNFPTNNICGSHWVAVKPWESNWRRNCLAIQLGIGYPF